MQEIAKTLTYTLIVDPAKNRIYCTVTGNGFFWGSTFAQDWERAAQLVTKGFTVVTDVSRIPQISREWVELSGKIQRMLVNAGLAGTAEILSERVAKQLGIHQINKITGNACYAKEEIFTDRKIAEIWLDRTFRNAAT